MLTVRVLIWCKSIVMLFLHEECELVSSELTSNEIDCSIAFNEVFYGHPFSDID